METECDVISEIKWNEMTENGTRMARERESEKERESERESLQKF